MGLLDYYHDQRIRNLQLNYRSSILANRVSIDYMNTLETGSSAMLMLRRNRIIPQNYAEDIICAVEESIPRRLQRGLLAILNAILPS